jgi:hypothetical protein
MEDEEENKEEERNKTQVNARICSSKEDNTQGTLPYLITYYLPSTYYLPVMLNRQRHSCLCLLVGSTSTCKIEGDADAS